MFTIKAIKLIAHRRSHGGLQGHEDILLGWALFADFMIITIGVLMCLSLTLIFL